ncbi:MAG: VanZ like protein [Verrucomicrobiaceae bacterium]|nr:VanZ like protein [Verrucomicrobiaceae bacterium]
MLLYWLDVRLARVGLIVAALAITTLALMPGPDVPITTSWDKLDHWTAFFTLAFLANHSFPRLPFWRAIALALVAYGIGIEIAQSFTPTRDADPLDVVADSIGIVIYGAVLQLRLALFKPQLAE